MGDMKEASARIVKRSTQQLMHHAEKLKSDIDFNFSEDSFDWEINLNDNQNHDDEGKLLTSFVRRTYIKHLHKSLVRNYNIWIENYGGGVELSEAFIARCAAELEKKAVRASMLASLYQHYIITLIKNIKKSTDNNKLYEDLLTSFNTPSKKCDKSIQTATAPNVCSSSQPPAKQLSPTVADSTLTPAEQVTPKLPYVTKTPANQLLPTVADSTLTPAKQVIPKVPHVTEAPDKHLLPIDADSTEALAEQDIPNIADLTKTPAVQTLSTNADSTLAPSEQVISNVADVTETPAKLILPNDADSTLAPAEQVKPDVADVIESPDKFSPTVDDISDFLDEDLLSIPLPAAVDSTLGQGKQLIPHPIDSTLANVHSTVDTSSLNVAIDSHILDTLAESYVVPPKPVPNPYNKDPNSSASSKFFVSYLPKEDSVEKRMSRLSNASESSVEVSSSKMYDPEVDLSESHIPSDENKGLKRKKGSVTQECIPKKRKSSSGPMVQQKSLEERLKKFEEIFGDTCEDVPPDPQPPDKAKCINLKPSLWAKFFSLVTWKQEKIAQTCELNRKLQMVPPSRLRLLRASFKQLFGPIDQVTDITPEDFTHCRRRLAHMIVFSLTPYFEFGQIGSREVFKALAREITRIILNDTYAADLDYTQKIVDEVFQTGVRYRTLEDVNILCNR